MVNLLFALLFSLFFLIYFFQDNQTGLKNTGLKTRVISPESFFLEDPKGVLTLNNVTSKDYEGRFKPFHKQAYNFGLSRHYHWIRFKISKKEASKDDPRLFVGIDYATLEQVVFYVPMEAAGGSQYKILNAGWKFEGKRDDLGFVYPVFQVPDNFDESGHFYLCIKSSYSSCFGISLYDSKYLNNMRMHIVVLHGFLFGILFAMLFYNLSLFIFLRDKNYLFYVLYMVWQIIYQVSLVGTVRIISPGAGEFFVSYTVLFAYLTLFFAGRFTSSFLDTRRNTPKLDVIFRIFEVFFFIGMFLMIMQKRFEANYMAHFLTMVYVVFTISTAIVILKKGFKPARNFLAAWLLLFVGTILHVMRGLGAIPINIFTSHLIMVTASAEAIFLSFALADRIATLRQEKATLKENEKRLTALSITDELTGLYNKRYFQSKLITETHHALKIEQPFSLIMLDVDHFKEYNDTYGHSEGDKVLSHLGATILGSIRNSDYPCRFGGEEFCILLPETELNKAVWIAQRIRSRFEKTALFAESKLKKRVTISGGVAQLKKDETGESLFSRADKLLYAAKEKGRNKIDPSGRF